MRSLAFIFALLVATRAAPQGYGSGGGGGGGGGGGSIRFTQKEYSGLQQALGYRVPVGIYSANQVFSMVEEFPSDFVVLNLPGLSMGGGGGGGSGYSSRSGISVAQARTGIGSDVAEAFRDIAEDAVEEVEEAAEDSVNRIGEIPATPDSPTPVEPPVVPVETEVRSSPVEAAPETPVAAEPAVPAAPAAAPAVEETAPVEAVEAVPAPEEPAAENVAPAAVAEEPSSGGLAAGAEAASVKRKRQVEEEEEEERLADELSFAFAGLGSLIGSNLGRYMDATYSANVDLLHGFENVGLLVLDQVDERLEERQKRLEKRRQQRGS